MWWTEVGINAEVVGAPELQVRESKEQKLQEIQVRTMDRANDPRWRVVVCVSLQPALSVYMLFAPNNACTPVPTTLHLHYMCDPRTLSTAATTGLIEVQTLHRGQCPRGGGDVLQRWQTLEKQESRCWRRCCLFLQRRPLRCKQSHRALGQIFFGKRELTQNHLAVHQRQLGQTSAVDHVRVNFNPSAHPIL